ncbi:hypothetical protein LCGC14_2204830 [marine sediment metagenome]|uniref:Uncharacterized protein n=1 Tax=marine sediment metagenome TaxID=412755 RepID=A0A0F9FSZ0_9ZZZZ
MSWIISLEDFGCQESEGVVAHPKKVVRQKASPRLTLLYRLLPLLLNIFSFLLSTSVMVVGQTGIGDPPVWV